MTRKSRKAQVFTIGVVLIVIAALTTAFFLVDQKNRVTSDYENLGLGAKQLAVIETYQRAEGALLYLDISISFALPESLARLARNGGFATSRPLEQEGLSSVKEVSECGSFIYPLWNSNVNGQGSQTLQPKSCIPDAESSLKGTLSTTLDEHLSQYSGASFPEDNYVFVLKRGVGQEGEATVELTGRAITPISFIISAIGLEEGVGTPDLSDISSLAVKCTASSCKLNKEAAEQLRKTAESLKQDGRSLIITSAYRDIEKQRELYAKYAPICGGCVAKPNPGAPHVVGGAIDIKMLKDGREIPGGPSGAEYAYSHYTFSREQLAVHKEIEDIMCRNGWVRYKDEWWHFEYGTARWAQAQEKGVCFY